MSSNYQQKKMMNFRPPLNGVDTIGPQLLKRGTSHRGALYRSITNENGAFSEMISSPIEN